MFWTYSFNLIHRDKKINKFDRIGIPMYIIISKNLILYINGGQHFLKVTS